VVRVLVWDPAHFVMVRRMLEGIRERAEDRPLVPPAVQFVARVGWILAAAGLLALFLAHRHFWAWFGATLLLLVPPFLGTADLEAILAGFLAIGVTLTGAVAFGSRWWSAYLLIASLVLLVLLLAPDAYARLDSSSWDWRRSRWWSLCLAR
jgi:hypothetical protein